jgi:hypothetical protein
LRLRLLGQLGLSRLLLHEVRLGLLRLLRLSSLSVQLVRQKDQLVQTHLLRQ